MYSELAQAAPYVATALFTVYATGFIAAAAFFGGDKGIIKYHTVLFRFLRSTLGGFLVALGSLFRGIGTTVRGKQKSKKDESH